MGGIFAADHPHDINHRLCPSWLLAQTLALTDLAVETPFPAARRLPGLGLMNLPELALSAAGHPMVAPRRELPPVASHPQHKKTLLASCFDCTRCKWKGCFGSREQVRLARCPSASIEDDFPAHRDTKAHQWDCCLACDLARVRAAGYLTTLSWKLKMVLVLCS